MRTTNWLVFLFFMVLLPAYVEAETGTCVEGVCENGIGVYALPDGTVYEGEFGDYSIAHGQGKITYPSGNVYEGRFRNDQFEGEGTYSYQEGTYVGEFLAGKFHGRGTHVYRKGGVYIGHWKDGKYHGKGTFVHKSGTHYVGEWQDGVLLKK